MKIVEVNTAPAYQVLIGSGLLETVIIFVAVDCLNWNGNWMKLFTNVMVIVLNYLGSKLLVFGGKRNQD